MQSTAWTRTGPALDVTCQPMKPAPVAARSVLTLDRRRPILLAVLRWYTAGMTTRISTDDGIDVREPALPAGLGGEQDELSLEQQAYTLVLDWLLRGHARPGQMMPLREMSRHLGMSRTPLRAALGRLHEQGLVAYNARVGFTVATPTPADLYELFDLRIMCEAHGVRHFFEDPVRHVPPELTQLAREGLDLAGQIAGRPEKFPAFSEADARFHRTIVQLAGSQRLLDWYQALNLRVVIFRLGWTESLGEERFRIAAEEHLQIADALGHGEAETLRLLAAHVMRVRDQTIGRMVRVRANLRVTAAPGVSAGDAGGRTV
jgi:DNA-binding GntR family transcriptional regulator